MRTQAILDFCAWIEQTPLSRTVQDTPWLVPTLQTVHILGIAAVLASALMINLRLLGVVAQDQPLARIIARFRPVIWWTLPLLLVTGMVMISGEPARSLANSLFQLKMLLLLAAIIVTLAFQAPQGGNADFWDASDGRRRAAKAMAIASLLLWTGIVFAGRWIAYT